MGTHRRDLRQLLVVLFKERQVLERHVHIRVAAILAMQLLGLAPAREAVLVDLVLDLVGRIRHVDGRVGIRRRHFALGALQGGQELAVEEAWLGVLELLGNVTCETELRGLLGPASA